MAIRLPTRPPPRPHNQIQPHLTTMESSEHGQMKHFWNQAVNGTLNGLHSPAIIGNNFRQKSKPRSPQL
jgi:hypothetical protein